MGECNIGFSLCFEIGAGYFAVVVVVEVSRRRRFCGRDRCSVVAVAGAAVPQAFAVAYGTILCRDEFRLVAVLSVVCVFAGVAFEHGNIVIPLQNCWLQVRSIALSCVGPQFRGCPFQLAAA